MNRDTAPAHSQSGPEEGEAGPSTYSHHVRRDERAAAGQASEEEIAVDGQRHGSLAARIDAPSPSKGPPWVDTSGPGRRMYNAEYRHDPFLRVVQRASALPRSVGRADAGVDHSSGRGAVGEQDMGHEADPDACSPPLASSSSAISDAVVPPAIAGDAGIWRRSSGPRPGREPKAAVPSPSAVVRAGKRRPVPLNLAQDGGTVRVDPELQEHLDDIAQSSAISAITTDSTLSDELYDLTLLRDTVHRNLRDRPMYSPEPDARSLSSSSSASPTGVYSTAAPAPRSIASSSCLGLAQNIEPVVLSNLLDSDEKLFILDTRPLEQYLDAHLLHSVNISLSAIDRQSSRRQSGHLLWQDMEASITTPEGKALWRAWGARRTEGTIAVLASSDVDQEVPERLLPMLAELAPECRRTLIKADWGAIMSSTACAKYIISADTGPRRTASVSPRPPKRSATLPPEISPTTHQRQSPKPRPELTFLVAPPTPPSDPLPRLANKLSMPSLRAKRGQPTLTLQTGSNVVNGNGPGPPVTSLGASRPIRSATASSFPRSPTSLRSTGLRINTAIQISVPAASDRLSDSSANAHAESSQPRSPLPRPRTPVMTPRPAMSPFIVSCILPGFLFLGPEIANDQDVDDLRRVGCKRILNVAMECEDESLGLAQIFDRYLKIPMRDTVEESGVGRGIRESCDFLDDARLHNAPTYVHCKAGKSRSVTVVLAYLIHAHAWTLKTSYAYVAERRKGISPNIGFVAELMQYEQAELGTQSNGVHGDSINTDKRKHKYSRESLPPAPFWSTSLDTRPSSRTRDLHPGSMTRGASERADYAGRIKGDDDKIEGFAQEREVRKDGQWVHQRRPPVDRTTLQPGRRASKAGLESLRTMTLTPQPPPTPSCTLQE